MLSHKGYELQKALPNTSEDYFNRSEVTYEVDGVVKILSVLYLRYFEENLEAFISVEDSIISFCQERNILFKDVFAVICLLKNQKLMEQKRLYLGSVEQIKEYIVGINMSELEAVLTNTRPVYP